MSCLGFTFRRKGPPRQQSNNLTEDIPGIGDFRLYTYKQLKMATEDFSSANKIGEGGFGSVYKGKLKDGELVAIKVLSSESRQGQHEFVTELNLISDIVHENLVRLHGCCAEGDHRILVYGYLENNSLAHTLLGSSHSGIHFNWNTRKKICIGIARGLAFLHEEVQPRIIHRDIKASNILLDKDLNPKISDFGLAKILPLEMTHVSTRVAGTLGYLAPEYAIRGQLTRKSDVYSYGVLLLEIVSGKCHSDKRLPYDDQLLLERIWRLFELDELATIIDPSLTDDLDTEEACKFLKVGLLCTQDSMKLRPSMSNIFRMLSGEMDIDSERITNPGLITDVMDLKIRSQRKAGEILMTSTSSPFSSDNSTHATMSFTAITERD